MPRRVNSAIVAALLIGVLIGAVFVYALPSLAANKKAGSTTIVETSTVTSISTSTETLIQPTTVIITNTTTLFRFSPVSISGSLTVPSGSANGELVIMVNNYANQSINAVTIALSQSDAPMAVTFAALNGASPGAQPTTAGGAAAAVLCWEPMTIPACAGGGGGSAIETGSLASTYGETSGAAAGSVYTFIIDCYFGNSATPDALTFTVAAQV